LKDRLLYVWKIPSFPILFLTNFIVGLSSSFFAPYSSLFGLDEVGMSNIGFGVFMTIMSLGGITISTYIGKRSDQKVSRKRLMILTSIAAVLGYFGFAYLRNYYLLAIVGFFLLGTASATTPQLWAYAREVLSKSNVPKHETPYVMNVFRAFFALAWTVGPALAAWVLLMLGFRGLFSFVALGYFLTLLAITFLLKDVPFTKVEKKKKVVLRKVIFQPYIFANIVAMLLLTASTSINMMNVPQFVTKVLHGTEMNVGIIFSVPPVFEVPFMLAFGVLATKLDNALLIKLGFLISFIYFSLIGFVTEPWQIYPLQILSAAQVSITAGIAVTYFQDFIPSEPGTATTLYMNTQQVGSILSFLLFGVLSQYLNYRSVFYVCVAFTGIALLILLISGKQQVKYENYLKTEELLKSEELKLSC
jgi:SET family sugar efflux transporter-like MFS transporter